MKTLDPMAPKISGFSIIKNGEKLGFPYLASLRSLEPLVDELVVAHGDSEDETAKNLEALKQEWGAKMRIVHSPWDKNNQKHGSELARQTNIALDACQFDLCFYLQSDEVLHEEDYPTIRRDIEALESDPELDALCFHWVHFYGDYAHTVYSKKWYRRELRVIKKSYGLRSLGDAQGFRVFDPTSKSFKKARAALTLARVFHYGWTRPSNLMIKKTQALDELWGHQTLSRVDEKTQIYQRQFGLNKFSGTHPVWMKEHIANAQSGDPFAEQKLRKNFSYCRLFLSDWIERLSGWRPGEFTNYRSLKKLF